MSVPAYQNLAADLRDRIVNGEFRPGDRLPVEPDLSARYGVSRSTVREALRLLASQNLITTTRGVSGGSFVVVPRPDQISAYLRTSLGLLAVDTQVNVDQLLEIRDLLEVPATALAASRRTQDDLDELHAALFDPATLPVERMWEPNRRFHQVLLRASGNPLLAVVAQPVFQVLEEGLKRDEAPAGFWLQVDRDHREILAYVAAGDEQGAREAAHAHLTHLRSTYVDIAR
ncbi:FadR family transcriptional regulator [Nonomuraea sp. NBC_01738]|uniref:FadR/GntR family transcriptional regulator n=1 Tax=Nonomuraea sp. NBC_01738 TaxID=2976003 RepID=UPI002E13BD70|nr:FadR family transcriptional regulator [Nonomuraea sp. NBC_01738]